MKDKRCFGFSIWVETQLVQKEHPDTRFGGTWSGLGRSPVGFGGISRMVFRSFMSLML